MKTVINLPKAKFTPNSEDNKEMQATLALFNQTAERIDPKELKSLGKFSSDENFDLDVYYKKVEFLPLKTNLKSNQFFSSVNDEDKRIPAIEGYSYISFSDLDNPDYLFTLKGMKNVLNQINQHFEEGIAWDEIA